ncbi:transmembrane amino acid transporter [Enterospora canceri]|uniref:Transmembrane amino acid transporter n=1 Tax=Enterospora canceri TaxID=1081671 RepID=A0A1Y1S6S8_9MICR|nr:transmembrane amino acid transporter [Enterospora canceri]
MNKSKNSQNGFAMVFFNILKACIGGGILEYPYLYQQHGVILATFYTTLFGTISLFGCILYMRVNDHYGKNNTLSSISLHIYPKTKVCIDAIILFKCFIVLLSYFCLIHESLTTICNDLNIKTADIPHKGFAMGFTTVGFLFTLPFVMAKHIKTLKKTSFLGMVGVVMLLIASLMFWNTDSGRMHTIGKSLNPITNLGSFVFSYTCHQNIISVHNEADMSYKELCWSIAVVYGCTTLIYVTFGMINYFCFAGRTITNKIFDTWPASNTKTTALTIYTIFLVVTIPLHVHPIKTQISELAKIRSRLKEKALGVLITVVLFIMAVSGLFSFKKVSRFVAQTFSALLVFIIPSFYYLTHSGKKKPVYCGMVVFAIAVGILCLVKTVLDITPN